MQNIVIIIVFICSIFLFLETINNKNKLIKEKNKNLLLVEQIETFNKDNLEKDKMISHIVHELRTPVAGISGILEIMQPNIENKEKVKDYLEKMNRSAKYLNSLIDDVLDVCKIKSGNTVIRSKPIDINKLIDNCISMTSERFKDRKIEYIKSMENIKHYNLIGDELHLCQIFINILSNAVKFTPDGGNVIFRIRELIEEGVDIEDKAYFQFQIIDTGVGMRKEFLNNIWNEFAQDDNVASSKYKGSGLGMAITKQFVDLMGGTINVESEIGKGSAFTINIHFDTYELFNKLDKITKQETVENQKCKQLKIILVDDDELNIEIEKYMLEKENIIVMTAQNGEEAVKLFEESPNFEYDAILMDINMPIMNGFDATKEIRSLNREDSKEIPIIAMTANSYGDEVQKIKESGMSEYLTKPIDINRVLKSLKYYKNGVNKNKSRQNAKEEYIIIREKAMTKSTV
ncbi:MAG: response regulator [Clostridia bacterium]|nr:response regulator [Clostridia bacterium]